MYIFLLFLSILSISGNCDKSDPSTAVELLKDLLADPSELIEILEKYKTSDLIEALGIHSSQNYSINEECHQELTFLGYGMIDMAKKMKYRLPTSGSSAMTENEKKEYLIPMMDAAGKIGSGIARGHLLSAGAFLECRSVKMYSTTLNRTIRGDFFRILFDIKMRPNSFNDSCLLPQIGVDICLPYSCRNEDLTEYFREALGVSKQFSPVCSVVNVNSKVPVTTVTTYIVGLILSLIVLLVIISGTTDYYLQVRENSEKSKKSTFFWKMFVSFSFYRNLREIFSMRDVNKPGQVTSLNCIRVISTVWVILGHCAAVMILTCSNPADLLDYTKTSLGTLMANAYFAVDTFFFISAFLLSFLWFKQYEKRPKTVNSGLGWSMFYVHRIARLTPVYYITLFFFTFIYTRLLNDMPLFMSPAVEADTCQHNFWINLLYIDNFVDPQRICYVISWYLATDLQLYLLSPILLIGFALGGKIVGFLVAFSFFTASTLFNAYQMFFWHFPPTQFQFGPKDPRYDPNERRYDLWNYYNPLIRCQIYIMGLVLGYFMRKTPKFNINPWFDRLMWLISTSSMLFIVLVIQDYTSGHLWTPAENALYSCFGRVIWGFGLSWIIISNYYRRGLISDFMSLPFWTPLARLSFCAYLVHIMVTGYFFGRNHSELYFTSLSFFLLDSVVPVTCLSFLLAIFWSICFELPFAKIEAIIFGGGGTTETTKTTKTTNLEKLEIRF